MVNYRHLFFDLDRTLWDYDLNAALALQEVFENYKLQSLFNDFDNFKSKFEKYNDQVWEDYVLGLIKKNDLRILRFELLLKDCGVIDYELAVSLNRDYLKICPMKTNLISGAIELLEYLKDKRYHLYILTNGFTHIQEKKMSASGLNPYFLKLFSSDKSGHTKPQRAMFENAIKSVNARKKESLMIGDDLKIDILGAKTFGIDQVYYNPSKAIHSETVTYEINFLQEMKEFL